MVVVLTSELIDVNREIDVADDTGQIFDVGFEPKPAGVAFQETRDRIGRGGRHCIAFEPAVIRGKIVFAIQ